MLKQGLVQVYTGKTRQMNLSHIGLALRATGQNLRTFLMGFLTHPFVDTEDKALSFLKPNVVVKRIPVATAASVENSPDSDRDKIRSSFKYIHDIILGGSYDIVILEEINQIVKSGIIPPGDIMNLIKKKPAHVELVLTGRDAKDEIIEQADLVTEMVEYKVEEGSWEVEGRNREGCIGVVTGNGKGKTTYCLGRAMFFAANGIPSSMLQFIKSPLAYGEVIACERFPNLEIKSMGEGFIFEKTRPSKKHREAARSAWEECLREIFSLTYRLIVLDEINVATQFDLVHPDRVREMMFLKPRNLHIVLSGRGAHPEMMEHASAVFEMKEIKHPFHRGIQARRGIEF
ncbi:MAG: cob(I)yrinic acid a,c-diamide adenosyltransferase [Deltaproteobacteria bacterium]|nr:cob(I)yrinic acid a,c-diamide adenosyltransferase [Deltaproteobacteria bacterium]